MTAKKDFLYIQLYNKFKENIENNIWAEGIKLPSEYELMEKYKVSRDTIRKSLQRLAQEGYVYRQAGKGTFVNNLKSRYKLTSLESFSEQMLYMGLIPSSKILSLSLEIPNGKIKDYLEIIDDEKVYRVERLRLANGEPMCYEIAYVSERLCPDLDKLIYSDTSLYEIYEEHYNLKLDYGNLYLEAEGCPKEYSHHLKIKKGSPMLKMKCIVYTDNKKPLYFVESYYIGTKYVFFASMPRI
ncbi:GntR family transcriptional regulator [Tissierella praeacuta DSM 18095]|uniref:GntR family transcriptional regulator n=1 Tax=Tissierella praeacuta DSM 18095 TaxID=1123404 RepID=A0A1M4TNB5_9FIRM|nr:GntR family transcriptional regulator [Tissierella praeacuta]SHE45787.1 GntR family transcriptional regulator [Tissierella praeacuta DSM 18095]SUP04483.1 HTH-type transcriptional repressor yvoA [Tissierella praeacuta]